MSSIYDRLGTLSTPARVRLLRLLELEELQVGEIASIVQMPQSTVSRHLKALREEGWVSRRKEGTSSLFRLAPDLPEGADQIWRLVSSATDGEHPEDGLRLASVLAQRENESRAWFGSVGDSWSDIRRELYGEAFLLPSLLALLPPEMVVADIGCGPGDVVGALAPWVKKVVGVDREPAMLDAARRNTEEFDNVELRRGALEDLPLEVGEVDVALLMLVLHHVARPGTGLAAIRGALRPRGRVVVVDMVAHERDEYRQQMGHVHLGFSPEDLQQHATAAKLSVRSYDVVPPDPSASGPALFVAVLQRDEERRG